MIDGTVELESGALIEECGTRPLVRAGGDVTWHHEPDGDSMATDP